MYITDILLRVLLSNMGATPGYCHWQYGRSELRYALSGEYKPGFEPCEFLRVRQVKQGRDLWLGQKVIKIGFLQQTQAVKAGCWDIGRKIDHTAGEGAPG